MAAARASAVGGREERTIDAGRDSCGANAGGGTVMEFPVRSRPAKFKASPSDERGGGHRAVKPETRSKRDVYQGLEFREFDQDREDLNFGSEMDSMSLTQRPFRTPAVPRSEFSFGRSGGSGSGVERIPRPTFFKNHDGVGRRVPSPPRWLPPPTGRCALFVWETHFEPDIFTSPVIVSVTPLP